MAMNGRPGIDIGRQVVAKGTGGRSISRRFATAEAVVEFFFLLCVAWSRRRRHRRPCRRVLARPSVRCNRSIAALLFSIRSSLLPTIDEIGRERTRGGRTKRRFSSFLCVCVCVSSCRVVELHGVFKVSAWQNGGRRPNVAEPFFFRATRRRSIFFSSAFGSQLFPVFKVSQPVKWRRRR